MKFVIALLLTFAAFGSSLAHAQDEVTVAVPFDFYVGNRLFHSGEYTISSSTSSAFQGALLIRSADGKTAGYFLSIAGENHPLTDSAKLVFQQDGDKHYLNEIVSTFDTFTLIDKR